MENLKLCNSSREDNSGGARVKNLRVKIRGANKILYMIIMKINTAFKKTWYISHVEKFELSSIVSIITESS